MKIVSIKLGSTFNSLQPFDQGFRHATREDGKIDPICFVGINGSGKSNLLELIVEPFFYLEKMHRFGIKPKKMLVKIELIYTINEEQGTEVKIDTLTTKTPVLSIKLKDTLEWKEINDNAEILKYLPHKIIGYTSGMNETLSFRLNQLDEDYSKLVLESARNQSELQLHDNRMIFLDYASNEAITVSNFIFRSDTDLKIFDTLLRIKSLHSFKVIINLKRKNKSSKNALVILSPELQGNIQKLINCCICHNNDEEAGYYEMDFLNSPETQSAFKDNFDSVYDLFMCFQKFELLNPINLEKKYRKTKSKDLLLEGRPVLAKEDKVFRFDEIFIEISNPKKIIPYIGISDGEHQFLQILGACMIFDREDILFLLDEPETHFNPLWRTKFINILNDISEGRKQEFILTTHSPYIVSDCKGYRVFKFERNGEIVTFDPIGIETYGTSFDLILKKAFNIDSTISDEAKEEINNLIKDGTADQITDFLNDSGPSVERMGLIKKLNSINP